MVLVQRRLVLLLLVFHSRLAAAWQLHLSPAHFHVMLDARKAVSVSDAKQQYLQAAGVDSFLVDSVKENDLTLLANDQCRPIFQRGPSINSINDDYRLWVVAPEDPTIETGTTDTDPNREAFVICGDDAFVLEAMNCLLPPTQLSNLDNL